MASDLKLISNTDQHFLYQPLGATTYYVENISEVMLQAEELSWHPTPKGQSPEVYAQLYS